MESRRTFVTKAAAGVAALGSSSLRAASDEVVVGVIGCGTRGARYLMPNFSIVDNCRIAAVCDVYKPNLERAASTAGSKVDSYGDYRRILERKDINVVIVATPDHWHGPITVEACEAGKDVYVEKPLSNNIEDCLKMVEAARKYKRVVQVGLQQRSSTPFLEAYKVIQKGTLGNIRHAVVVNPSGGPRRPRPGGYTMPSNELQPVPADLDWEMFQGAAPRRPFNPMRQRGWRSYWEYGAGTLSDWGVHLVDIAHWYLDVTKPPQTAAAAFGTFSRAADERTPDSVDVAWRYDNFVMSYSSRGEERGTYIYGDDGMLFVGRYGYHVKPNTSRGAEPTFEAISEELRDEFPADKPSAESDTGKHVRNFLECVRTRERPVVDVEIGAISTIPTLMGGLSILNQGKTISWEGNGARPLT